MADAEAAGGFDKHIWAASSKVASQLGASDHVLAGLDLIVGADAVFELDSAQVSKPSQKRASIVLVLEGGRRLLGANGRILIFK